MNNVPDEVEIDSGGGWCWSAIPAAKEEQKQKGWKPVEPDTRGYTNCFECPECGMFVHIGTFVTACDYDFCPYCGTRIEEGEQE